MSPVSTLAGYREKLFEMLPKLEVLDSTDKDGNEVEVADSDDEEEEDEDCKSSVVEGKMIQRSRSVTDTTLTLVT